jgi:predicted transcriptional regulator
MTNEVLDLTAQIVSAHLARNTVAIEELPALIREVYNALSTVGEAEVAEAGPPEPAVPVTKSVFPDYIVCLECGKRLTMLKRHLMAEHNMTVDQYRAKWGLPSNYPMVAPNYAKTRSELAKKMGLGRRRTVTPPAMKRARKAAGKNAASKS